MTPFRVLVVESDPWILGLACDLLVQAGYDVIPAPNGKRALKTAQSSPPQMWCFLKQHLAIPRGPDFSGRLRGFVLGPH